MSGFDDAFVQAVRDAADIVSVASEHTQLKQAGKAFKGLSPFKKEKTPSFTVDPEKGLYYCFSSSIGGDAIHLHMQLTGDDFPSAIETLAVRFGIPLPDKRGAEKRGPQRDVDGALAAGQRFFEQQFRNSAFARDYLERRRIPAELRGRFGLGYAPDSWDAMRNDLARSVKTDDLLAVGLIGKSDQHGRLYDRFRHRLMFPIHTQAGRLVGFGGRALGDDKAKYVNTSETDYFHKSRLLYGFHQAKPAFRSARRAILVEGYFDVIGTVAAGIEGAVAGMGTALTQEQARLLARFVDEVIVAYDGDSAGERAFERSLPTLLAEGLSVRRARLPEGHDPDSLRLEQGNDAVRAVLDNAEDAVWMLIARRIPPPGRRTPNDKKRAAVAIVEVLRAVADPLTRGAYVQRAAERLGVAEGLLSAELHPELARIASSERSDAPERTTRTTEEKALACMLGALDRLPSPEHLPTIEVFFDETCRNIYQTVYALQEEAEDHPPTLDRVLSRLREYDGSIDHTARLLLEETVLEESGSSETAHPAEIELLEILKQLETRWWKQRRVDLAQQISEALACGDLVRAERLREQKNDLTRNLHPEATGSL